MHTMNRKFGGGLLAAAVTLALGANVHAELIQITATGAVTSSNMSAFALGQQFTVELVYESVGSPQSIQNQQAFYVNHWRSIHITSGGYDTSFSGNFGQINKYDNLSNTDGISFQVAQFDAYYQFTNPRPNIAPLANVFSDNVTQQFHNLFINFAANNGNVWNNHDLPTNYNFGLFNATQNMIVSFSAGSFGVGWSDVQWQVVPAPSCLAVMSLFVLGSRRRR